VAVLLAGAALPLIFNRQLFERRPAAAPAPPTASATSDLPAAAASTGPSADARQDPEPAQRRIEAPPAAPRSARSAAAPAKARGDIISISANSYRVGPHKNFAEIHVSRVGAGSDTSFAWWTEPASALPDIDFVPQARAVQLLSKRSRTATLYVKLVANVSRKHPALFYVVIGEPANGTSLGRVTRTAISLPAQ
jgi:hypothetical protein